MKWYLTGFLDSKMHSFQSFADFLCSRHILQSPFNVVSFIWCCSEMQLIHQLMHFISYVALESTVNGR